MLIDKMAKNCRTSLEMIEKHNAVHLKDMIDTLNVTLKIELSLSLLKHLVYFIDSQPILSLIYLRD